MGYTRYLVVVTLSVVLCLVESFPDDGYDDRYNEHVCPTGQTYQVCGHYCTRTCYPQNAPCPSGCFRRCECPHDRFWHDGECVTWRRCEEVLSGEWFDKPIFNSKILQRIAGYPARFDKK